MTEHYFGRLIISKYDIDMICLDDILCAYNILILTNINYLFYL